MSTVDLAAMLVQQTEAVNNVYRAASKEGARSVIDGVRFVIAFGKKNNWKPEAVIAAIEDDLKLFERRTQ